MIDPDPFAVAACVSRALEARGIRYTIGGSIASSFAGEPRSTIDVDFVAEITEIDVEPLAALLKEDFYVDTDALHRAVRRRSTTNLIHHETSLKVDIFVAGGTPLDVQQIGRRQRVDVGGRTLYVHPPEDILLQKLRWYKDGGEVSDRQWRDILGIVRTQGARLDRAYLSANAPILGVSALLERALRESVKTP